MHTDLKMPSVSEEAKAYYKRFHLRTLTHPNPLVRNLANPKSYIPGNPLRLLKRKWCHDILAPNLNIN
ncbi:Uncharacterized protein FWK35_00018451 [Aphis craccivora]|uniref:Uncharacterized protein n=1 Tax=Aphis craccivora TaxID=307492 RepID=A0A6G0YFN9_APHCR|nr:Uncharacterized protein FWK35_00018451 [Aphis craccivora]